MAIGIAVAKGKGRSGFGWGVLCFLLGPIGIIWLLLMSDVKAPPLAVPDLMPASPATSVTRWVILKEVDPEIRQTAEHLAALHPSLEDEFSLKYMELGDKAYLGALAKSIEDRFRASEAQKLQSEELHKRRQPRSTGVESDEQSSGMIGPYHYVRTRFGDYIVTKNDAFVGKASNFEELVRRFGR